MKNNTKVRLHLSKQLFESLTKQVLAEAKNDMSGGAYTEAVKAPKAPKGGEAPKAHKAPAAPTHKKAEKPVSAPKKEMKHDGKLKEMEIPAGFEQATAELIDFLKTNGGFLAGVGGITGLAKLIANQLKNDPEARKNLDAITGAGSTKRDF